MYAWSTQSLGSDGLKTNAFEMWENLKLRIHTKRFRVVCSFGDKLACF